MLPHPQQVIFLDSVAFEKLHNCDIGQWKRKIFFSRLRSLFVLSALSYGTGFFTEIDEKKWKISRIFLIQKTCGFFITLHNHQLVHIIIIVCTYWRKRKIGLRLYFSWHFHGQKGNFLVLIFRCNSLFNTICFL